MRRSGVPSRLAAALIAAFAATSGVAPSARAEPAGGTATGLHGAAFEADIDRRVHEVMSALYQSRLSDAQAIADQLVRDAPEDPRTHLVHARVLRETFPDQNASKAKLERIAVPIYADLERAVAAADRMLDLDAGSLPGLLYRGWANMFEAQIATLCGEYWRAGRRAKAGKNDLDRVLAAQPDNSDAASVLGTYLYFADVLPAVVKVARTLVRVPGGDRARGLALLRGAHAGNGYNRLDARALVAVIEFAFEGDFEGARRDFNAMLVDFPDNPRLLEPIAVLALFEPDAESARRVRSTAALHATSPEPWNRQMAQRLHFYAALADLLDADFDTARETLESVRRSAPPRPDWFAPDVMLCAGELSLLLGDREPALALYASAAQSPSDVDDAHGDDFARLVEERLRFLRDPESVAPASEAERLREMSAVGRALRANDFAAADQLLEHHPSDAGPAVAFYRGESARRSERSEAAATEYARITDVTLPPRWRFFQFMAFARRAEAQARTGDRQGAARTLGRGLDFNRDPDLVRHASRARRRWFEREPSERSPATGDAAATTAR